MQATTRLYPTTALEDWVTDFYSRLGIVKPEHIKEEIIARKCEIYIHRKPRSSFYEIVGRYRGITVDNRVLPSIQREMFFHELSHILRHAGNQLMMPKAFKELQERDSYHFTRYAAIPHHMIHFIDLEDPYVIDQMTSLFKVTPELCIERLMQIQKRMKRDVW
ncbi:peptidase [Cytobacillus firmus]|uniref:ImmA/IrrE family metallo-endopeptidase n=1 Tax=Cytobacillus firmus TaxID=1399 RepID=UPI00207950EB|nr:ImmA/IrrE family metallo-endopeptidase [Cytobacillus firmus]USK40142.1 peptidase [Cytobacillus firmus]